MELLFGLIATLVGVIFIVYPVLIAVLLFIKKRRNRTQASYSPGNTSRFSYHSTH